MGQLVSLVSLAIEKFSASTTHIGQTLRSLCQRLQETECPNDVAATEALILEHERERQEVKDELASTINHGEILLDCFKFTKESDPLTIESLHLSSSKLAHVTAVERLLVQLEETEQNFDDFWYHHEKRLQQCLQLRKFEEDYKEISHIVKNQLENLESLTDIGTSQEEVLSLIDSLDHFSRTSDDDFTKAERVREMGDQLIEDEHYAVDCIRPKCIELQRVCEQYRELMRSRYDILHKSQELQEQIHQGRLWCSRGFEILSKYSIENCTTVSDTFFAIETFSTFLSSLELLKINNSREFRQLYENFLTDEIRAVVQDVVKQIEEVQIACKLHQENLNILLQKLKRPPSPPAPVIIPEQVTAIKSHQSRSQSPATDSRKRRKSQQRNKSNSRIEIIRTDDEHEVDSQDSHLSNYGFSDSTYPRFEIDSSLTKSRHVMKELIETERIYVQELRSLIMGYIRVMQAPEMQPSIPEPIRGKTDILFGNLEQIYEFHHNYFLKDLENCESNPESVGKCFINRKEEFQIYSIYCQNKPLSEELRQVVGDQHPFFKDCQKHLNHKLPLSAYLLKPVQRITKYQLLIKELLKYTNNELQIQELNEAVKTMLEVLKYVNDIMHQIAITGYPGVITDLGRILMQGPFTVIPQNRIDKIKDIRLKPMQRHIFLYEKKILLCKKRENLHGYDKACYIYKNSLDTSLIGLTEKVKGDREKRKFEIWLNGRTEVYTLQASTQEIAVTWVEQIKKVLMSQFDLIKKVKSRREVPTVPLNKISEDEQIIIPEENHVSHSNSTSSILPHPSSVSSMSESFSSSIDDSSRPASMNLEEYCSSDEFEDSAIDSCSDAQYSDMKEYIVLAEYNPVAEGEREIKLTEGDIVSVLEYGTQGWCYVTVLETNVSGWAPYSYLEQAKRLSSLSILSMTSSESTSEKSFNHPITSQANSTTTVQLSTSDESYV